MENKFLNSRFHILFYFDLNKIVFIYFSVNVTLLELEGNI